MGRNEQRIGAGDADVALFQEGQVDDVDDPVGALDVWSKHWDLFAFPDDFVRCKWNQFKILITRFISVTRHSTAGTLQAHESASGEPQLPIPEHTCHGVDQVNGV